MKRLPLCFSLFACSAMLAAFACGGISDPTRKPDESLASVSGALTGTDVPAGARVALVWKAGKAATFAVGDDVPVVGGQFTMNLAPPPSSWAVPAEASYDGMTGGDIPSASPYCPNGACSGGSTAGSTGTATGARTHHGAFDGELAPQDSVSGTVVTQPLYAAVAGFVVYIDRNGNGKLDIDKGTEATSPDDVIGGNRELLLTYMRGGGALDYEKLRDRAGIVPHQGYNLMWDEGRWLPLDVVELKIVPSTKLPNAVCSFYDGPNTAVSTPASPPTATTVVDGGASSSDSTSSYRPTFDGGAYPATDDKNLSCSPDGHSWTYSWPCTVVEGDKSAPKSGLCSLGYSSGGGMVCPPSWAEALTSNAPVPPGWPCPLIVSGGGPADAGGVTIDAGLACTGPIGCTGGGIDGGATSCYCTKSCLGHAYGVNCIGDACTCTTDGDSTKHFTGSCNDYYSQCGYP